MTASASTTVDAACVRHTLVLADDHEEVRRSLIILLSAQPDLDIVGESGDGLQAAELVEATRPELLVTDLNLPSLSGLLLAERVCQNSPRTRVIMISVTIDDPYVIAALTNGVRAYVSKNDLVAHLVPAIRAVLAGERYLSPPFCPSLLTRHGAP